MISLVNVTKSYPVGAGRKTVMRDVTMTLPRGRSVGILGRNGAGKSTLLNMIGGRIEPDSGVIRRDANISWPLGFRGVFQGSLTGAQNTRFIARIYGVDTDDLIASVAEFSELGDFMHMPVAFYSSGMKARLAFGVSMGIDFDVYLVDEITAVGDAAFKRKCQRAFRERLGRADIVMVSHGTGALRKYCDAGIVLEDGKMTYFDDIEQAIEAHERNMERPGRPGA
jgi:capsular polysaccharide transport system ATP-binding protein